MFQRKERQALQPHIHVARFSTENYDIIKSGFKEGKFKSTTFNPLRNMGQEKKHGLLVKFEKNSYAKSVLRKAGAMKKAKV